MQIGDRVKIEGDDTIYVVAGARLGRGLWLTVEEDEYDGYDGDLIVQQSGDEYVVQLCDSRSRHHGYVKLVPVETQPVELKKADAYEAYGIYADYDGNAPDTETLVLVESEELAKEVCDELNKDPRKYTVVYVEGWEFSKSFQWRIALTTDPHEVKTTAEEAIAVLDPDQWEEE